MAAGEGSTPNDSVPGGSCGVVTVCGCMVVWLCGGVWWGGGGGGVGVGLLLQAMGQSTNNTHQYVFSEAGY